MTRLRISTDGPLLLADGRRAVLEERQPVMSAGADGNIHISHSNFTVHYRPWQPVLIVGDENE